ncbi:MAG: hypothetical protein DRJ69_05560 [Thermoprotei archaeon]|nr:MAG: hypothetical protein DRJ69_05560 [Thermoprotei archaeon]
MIVAVIPTLNEEEGIGPTIKEYLDAVPGLRVIVADGGSTDSTIRVARSLGAEVIYVAEKGKGAAVSAALNHLRKMKMDPDFIIFVDGDYTYPADRLPDMIEILREDESVGAVLGNRLRNLSRWSLLSDLYLLGNLVIRQLYRAWSSINLEDPLSGLRVVRWRAVRDWSPASKGFEIETEMNFYLIQRGWKIAEVPINYRKRLGKKKLTIVDAIPIIRVLRNYSKKL